MNGPSKQTTGPHVDLRRLWPLMMIGYLLILVPALVADRATIDGFWSPGSADGSVATIIDSAIDGSQKTAFLVVGAAGPSLFQEAGSALVLALSAQLYRLVHRGGARCHHLAGLWRSREHRHAGTVLEPASLDYDARCAGSHVFCLLDALSRVCA